MYLTESDIDRAASFLDLERPEFERRHVIRNGDVVRLRETPNAEGLQRHCVFLSEQGCAIHEAKPLQCAAFPFWPEVIESEQAWKRTGTWCPGIGTGPLIQIETAEQIVAQVKAAFPRFYGS